MGHFASPDSRFYRFMSKLGDLILLNFLWMAGCLPVFTAGASTAALYAVMYRAAKNEEGYLARSFLREFRRNFRQATAIWLLLGGVGLFALADLRIMSLVGGSVDPFLGQIVSIAVTLLLLTDLLVALYAFPLQARYENSVRQTLYKAFLFCFGYFGYTFQMLGVLLLPLGVTMILGLATGRGLAWCFLFYLLAGFSATAYWMMKGPWGKLTEVLEKRNSGSGNGQDRNRQ